MKTNGQKRRLFRDRLKEDMQDPAFRKAYKEFDTPVRLAIQIAKLRQAIGMTQARLAKLIGTKQQVISRIEQGDEKNPTIGTLTKIAHALGKKLDFAFH